MSRGRHRGRAYWGILPRTGRHPRLLPEDIAVLTVRCGGAGILLGGLAGILLLVGDSGESVHPLTWAILSASFALIVAGYGIASYHEAAVRYTKIQQADEWLQVVHAHRVKVLALREKNLVRAIGELQDRFEVEKAALQEIREERMAHERMMGFVDGLQKSPAMRAFMENPRNRLRVVRDEDEESA